MPEVPIARVDLLRRRGDGNVACGGVGERVLAAAYIPLPPRRDHRQFRRERGVGELESHLIVPLAGTAMGERIGADRLRDLTLSTRDERSCDGGAQEVLA